MLLPEIDRTAGADDPLQADPEVRQARSTAQAARSRLAACVVGPQIDLAEAQRMLDALRRAEALAADAEDRVLVRNGLLTPADADRRAAARQLTRAAAAVPAADGTASADGSAPPDGTASADGTAPPGAAPSVGGTLVINFRTVRVPVPVPVLPILPPLPASARRTAVRAARVLLPVAAGLTAAALIRRLRRSRREPDLKN